MSDFKNVNAYIHLDNDLDTATKNHQVVMQQLLSQNISLLDNLAKVQQNNTKLTIDNANYIKEDIKKYHREFHKMAFIYGILGSIFVTGLEGIFYYFFK